jgi:predicted nucleotidyltransferase
LTTRTFILLSFSSEKYAKKYPAESATLPGSRRCCAAAQKYASSIISCLNRIYKENIKKSAKYKAALMSLEAKGRVMKITGVVCEFNPFHKGHEYLLRSLRARGAELIVCAMSGSFVQRGEPAIADKYSRAAMAALCGADVVVELPYPFSAASAEYFAAAGVAVLSALGVDTLGFGSECGDIEAMNEAAEVVSGRDFIECYRRRCLGGEGAAAAYFGAFREVAGYDMPSGSNDILGLEYIKAARRAGSGLEFETVKRVGSAYRSGEVDSELPSASAVRRLILTSGVESVSRYIPKAAMRQLTAALERGLAPADIKFAERAILSHLRLGSPGVFRETAEGGDGLGGRLHRAALCSVGFDELLGRASAKNYTDTRLRRAVLFCLTEVKKADLKGRPAYTLLLAASRRGLEYLKKIRGKTHIPIITKPADVRALGEGAARQRYLAQKAEALWTLMLQSPAPAGELTRARPVILRGD